MMKQAEKREPRFDSLEEKDQRLRALLKSYGSAMIALSGGVDSACLAYVAHSEMGEGMIAVAGDSPSYPTFQRELADQLTNRFGIRHEMIFTEEFEDQNYTNNPPN